MNTTMCSTSRIEPVRENAGMASALRIDSGNTVSAAAAAPEEATVCRKRRRLVDVIMFHLSACGMSECAYAHERVSLTRRCGAAGIIAGGRLLRRAVAGGVAHDGRDLLAVPGEAGLRALH